MWFVLIKTSHWALHCGQRSVRDKLDVTCAVLNLAYYAYMRLSTCCPHSLPLQELAGFNLPLAEQHFRFGLAHVLILHALCALMLCWCVVHEERRSSSLHVELILTDNCNEHKPTHICMHKVVVRDFLISTEAQVNLFLPWITNKNILAHSVQQ